MIIKNENTIELYYNDLFTKENNPSVQKYQTIYNKIKLLNTTHDYVYIVFSKNVYFLHPLFLLYICKYYDNELFNKNSKKLILSVDCFSQENQSKISHYLIQYIDYNIINLVESTELINQKIAFFFRKNQKILLVSKNINNFHPITFKDDKHYKTLPITKITPLNGKNVISDYDTTKDGDPLFLRRPFYISNLLDENIIKEYNNSDENIKNILDSSVIWEKIFSNFLDIDSMDYELKNSFSILLNECKKNIQEHTQHKTIKANGYIAFYEFNNVNEFIIYDDFIDGFLKSYKVTLEKELKNLEDNYKTNNDKIYETIYTQYDKNIKNIKLNTKESNKSIINTIFDKKDRFSIHQAGRMIMHFGLPSILKILDSLNSIPKLSTSASVTLYIHNNEKSYKVIYSSKENLEIEELDDNTLKGTVIVISIPKGLSLPKKMANNNFDFNEFSFSSTHYKDVLFEKSSIIEIIDRFNDTYIMNQPVKIKYDEMKFKDVSLFFREVLGKTFINNINDLLIYNFPIDRFNLYLELLIEIIFANNREYKSTGINIVMLDYSRPKAFFIGGRSKKECYIYNKNIFKNFNLQSTNLDKVFNLNTTDDNLLYEKNDIESNMFYQKGNLVHFDLFLKEVHSNGNYSALYTSMMNAFLNESENYLDKRVEVESHVINKFYLFKNIFEDSIWVKRIAFDLANRIKVHGITGYTIIGIGQYSSDIISILRTILNKQMFISNVLIINDINNYEYKNIIKDKRCIIFTPLILSGNKLKRFLLHNEINAQKIYCSINLLCKDIKCEFENDINFEPLFQKEINNIIENNKYNKESKFIFKKPLYNMAQDRYSISEYLHDDISSTKLGFDKSIKWEYSIEYGHTKRNNNHYLYYIKTVQLLNNNIGLVKKKFSKYNISSADDVGNNIILCSSHNTNSEFVAIINKVVFNNDARIHKFNLNDFEKTYNSVGNLVKLYEESNKCNFYFVDDCISTKNTLEKLHKVLRKISNKDKFEYIFTLIDRRKDLILKTKYSNNIESFINLNIRPIKVGNESCYLCNNKNFYSSLEKMSSLIYMKHQFNKKINKLEERVSEKIEYKKDVSIFDDFKDYLKMYAVEYIYSKLNENNIMESYDKYLTEIKEYFILHYLNDELKNITLIENLLSFEAKIAYIKALSFPKISYIPKIRNIVEKFIFDELNQLIEDSKGDLIIKFILTEHECKAIKNNQLIENLFINKISNYKYDMKCNIDYFNFLILRLSSFKSNYALYERIISFFYSFSSELRDNSRHNRFEQEYIRNLIQKYPIAIKILTSNNYSNSKLFNNQLKFFINSSKLPSSENEYNSKDSILFSMIIENIGYKRKYVEAFTNKLNKIDKILNSENKLKEIAKIIINQIENSCSFRLKNMKFYININKNSENAKYIDIFNNYEENTKDKHYVDILYRGAVKIIGDNEMDIELIKDKNEDKFNIWSNFYKEKKNYVLIMDNSKSKQLGIFVFDTNNNLEQHFESSKFLLMIQDVFVKFINDNNLISIETYTTKVDLSSKMAILGNIDHNHKSIYDELNEYRKNNILSKEEEKIFYYTFSTKYQILSNFNDSINAVHSNLNINIPLCRDFKSAIKEYYKSKIIYENKINTSVNTLFDLEESFSIKLNGLTIKSIVYELIANAYKASKSEEINVLIKTYNGCLYCINDGTEIKDESIKYLFRLNKRNGNVSGNGLYFIKEILTENGYDIEYVSKLDFEIKRIKPTFILKITKKV